MCRTRLRRRRLWVHRIRYPEESGGDKTCGISGGREWASYWYRPLPSALCAVSCYPYGVGYWGRVLFLFSWGVRYWLVKYSMGGAGMKIFVMKPPKFLRTILKKVFRIKGKK